MIGMVLPQRIFAVATVTVSGDGVTIKTGNSGDLKAYLQSASDADKAAISGASTIVFDGKFNGQDLEALNDARCCTQSTVDMAKAEFENYDDMKFGNWGTNVTTAITSSYLGPNDSASRDLLSGCSNLTTLTLGSGQFNAFNNNSLAYLTTVNIKKDVTELGQNLFSGKTAITTLDFEDGEKNLAIGEGCFNGCTGITSLNLPARLASLDRQAFANTTGVKSLSFHKESKLETIPQEAFLNCGNNSQADLEIEIPHNVTLIEPHAFSSMFCLKKIWFTGQSGDAPLVIKGGAFSGGEEKNYTISDVYVDVDPDDRKLICEYDAFPFVSLVGQTNVTSQQKATLHFNEGNWDYYAGDWKRGLSFDNQNALNCIKDGCVVRNGVPESGYFPKGPNDVKDHNGKVPDKMPANGWQQFAVTSTGIDIIIPPGEFIRTYSTSTAYDLPAHVRIFRVINFDDGYKDEMDANNQALADAAQKTAITKEVTGYIPKNTGLIMVGTVSSAVLYYFKENSGTDEYPHSGHTVSTIENPGVANLLVPTLDNDEFPLAPVWPWPKTTVEYRNFGMLKTDHKFGRAKVTTMRKNYAYLKIPAELFNWSNESENGGSGNGVENTTTNAKISVLYMFDDINEDNFGIATAIKNAINKEMSESNSYYTLQGVKVSKPTKKGVYISNGKKVLVK